MIMILRQVSVWVGTNDDFIGASDAPTKEVGSAVGAGGFAVATNAAERQSLKISSALGCELQPGSC